MIEKKLKLKFQALIWVTTYMNLITCCACELQPSEMQVAHMCGCKGILGCGVAGVATQNSSQVMLWWLPFFMTLTQKTKSASQIFCKFTLKNNSNAWI